MDLFCCSFVFSVTLIAGERRSVHSCFFDLIRFAFYLFILAYQEYVKAATATTAPSKGKEGVVLAKRAPPILNPPL
ncbi:hypothetical protein KCU77_g89, partial [Aureobasidium melanogenum]